MSDPGTWSSFAEVSASRVGEGIGYVLTGSDGLGVIDLDDCIDGAGRLHPVAERIVSEHPRALRVERSVSGRGLHVWDRMVPGPGEVRTIDGQQVETYTRSRFIAMGEPWPGR